MHKRLKDLLELGDFPSFEGDDDIDIAEELIIDLDELSEAHDVIRIKMPRNSVVGEIDTGGGREMVIYRGLSDAAA